MAKGDDFSQARQRLYRPSSVLSPFTIEHQINDHILST